VDHDLSRQSNVNPAPDRASRLGTLGKHDSVAEVEYLLDVRVNRSACALGDHVTVAGSNIHRVISTESGAVDSSDTRPVSRVGQPGVTAPTSARAHDWVSVE